MPEIDPITWYYTLKTKTANVKLGTSEAGYLRSESSNCSSKESNSLAERFNNLSLREREYFISNQRDFYYDPPRESVESYVRERIEALGWFDEFELEYLLSPPNEKYVGPGTKEWEGWEKFVRDNPYMDFKPW